MSSRDVGRRSSGPRSSGTSWLPDLKNLIRYLHSLGYSTNQIINFLSFWDLGTPTPGPEPDRPTPEPDRPTPTPKLTVKGVDLQVPSNTVDHHTDEYELVEVSEENANPPLVVRRGQPFNISVLLSSTFNSRNHDVRLVFVTGDVPTESKNTQAAFLVSDKDEDGDWGAKLVKKNKDSVELKVFTPPDCIVDIWRLTVELFEKGQDKPISETKEASLIYILFNPWCKDDVVYMANEEELQEYVLNDTGCIFMGNEKRQFPKPWIFGQFSGDVLDCCMYLLSKSELKMEARGNPIKVVRKLSSLVNAPDNRGVLVGNWSGDYEGGASPGSWTGSAKILEKYYSTNQPVKYGQCWVFSGVLTTVLRALGIPARSVTNFASAHDTDLSVTIDFHLDTDGEEMTYKNSDSIWNFHVWNDAWMRRDDLPEGYGGWQACDATPQEASENLYQCGPCPLLAIKQGNIHILYDAPFIFAEVNADRVYWKQKADRSFEVIYIDRSAVGKKMSTKVPMTLNERSDVTHLYKYPEGSHEERAAVMKAYGKSPSRKKYEDAYETGPTDVEFKLEFNEKSPVGGSFLVRLLCKNKSNEVRTLNGHGRIKTMYYTGIPADQVAHKEFKDLKIRAGSSQSLEIMVNPREYQKYLKDGCHLWFQLVLFVRETKQSVVKTDTIVMLKPELTIETSKIWKIGVESKVTVSFPNPLPGPLTDCSLEVEGPGITKEKTYPQGDVAPNGTFLATLMLKPKKKGKKKRGLNFVFSSKELADITGACEILVEK